MSIGRALGRVRSQQASVQAQVDAFERDSLTGLLTQAGLLAAAPSRIGALILFDIDHFRVINTALDLEGGDRVLIEVAKRVAAIAPATALAARTGVDEFAILLDADSAIDSGQFARRLTREIERPIDAGAEQVVVSIAVSVSEPEEEESLDGLLRRAGASIHLRRRQSRWSESDEADRTPEQLRQRFTVERELRDGLAAGELRLYYQPIVDLQTNRTAEFEALLRWEHQERGTLLPADFLFDLSSNKLERDIGRWVLSEACRQARTWQTALAKRTLVVAVNLSPSQISDPDLIEDVRRVLAETGLDPASLRLEISESITAAEIDDAVRLARELRQLGVQLALDDFGAGNAGWMLLRQSQVDSIKLDQSFIADDGVFDAENIRMIEALADFASQLGIVVSIEGVERAEQASAMRDVGVHQAQGFYFAPPQPPGAMAELLVDRPVRPHG